MMKLYTSCTSEKTGKQYWTKELESDDMKEVVDMIYDNCYDIELAVKFGEDSIYFVGEADNGEVTALWKLTS